MERPPRWMKWRHQLLTSILFLPVIKFSLAARSKLYTILDRGYICLCVTCGTQNLHNFLLREVVGCCCAIYSRRRAARNFLRPRDDQSLNIRMHRSQYRKIYRNIFIFFFQRVAVCICCCVRTKL